MNKTLEQWKEFARRDDCLDRMVPSDLRAILAEKEALQRRVAELALDKSDLENERDLLVLDFKRLTADNKRLREALENAKSEANRDVAPGSLGSAVSHRFRHIFHICETALSPQLEGQDDG